MSTVSYYFKYVAEPCADLSMSGDSEIYLFHYHADFSAIMEYICASSHYNEAADVIISRKVLPIVIMKVQLMMMMVARDARHLF